MQLPLQTFTSLVQNMSAGVQSAAAQLLDLTIGSTLRAILEATASIALWMQWLILQVLQMTRAATSSGADLDSWMADFSLTRLPASPSSGMVTFSRFDASIPALVPVGALVRTADGTRTFATVEEVTSSGWSQVQNGYVISVGSSSLDVPIVAEIAGTSGNVQAQAISVLASAVVGIDSVLNAAPLVNGVDAESDPAFRLRFQNFLGSLSRATLLAVGYAINAVQQGLSYTIQENQNPSGMYQLGNFVIVVDDGSGYPSSTLLSMIQQAVEVVRPIGSTFAVFAPTVTQVDVSLCIGVASSASLGSVSSQIVSGIGAYVNGLSVGAPLPVSRIVLLAYTASSAITNVTEILLNGQTADIAVAPSGVIKIGMVTVS